MRGMDPCGRRTATGWQLTEAFAEEGLQLTMHAFCRTGTPPDLAIACMSCAVSAWRRLVQLTPCSMGRTLVCSIGVYSATPSWLVSV